VERLLISMSRPKPISEVLHCYPPLLLFGTELSVEYALGMTNVLAAVFLYNAQDLEKHAW